MTRRTAVKWLHWISFGLIIYFFISEPHVRGTGDARAAQLSTHAGMGMILALITLIWSILYLSRGQLGRPGPKLPDWGKRVYRIVNTGLYWMLPVMVLSGALAGLVSDYPVAGFGSIPLNPTGWGTAGLHDLAEEIHAIVFNATLVLISVHALFHIWRHFRLRDNALRLMVPKMLHRYL